MKLFDLPIKIEVFVRTALDGSPKYLLLKRSAEDGGFWQPITGTMESPDSIENCLLRELREETGIVPGVDSMLSDVVHEFTWQKNEKVITEYVFFLEVPSVVPVTLSHEHTDFVWASYEEALSLLEKQNNKNALNIIHTLKDTRL